MVQKVENNIYFLNSTFNMGLYDKLKFNSSCDFPEFTGSADISDIEWQTKELGRKFQDYKVGKSGHLYVKNVERREMTEKEKNEYARSRGYESWDSWVNNDENYPLQTWSKTVSKEEWVEKELTESFEIHTIVDNNYWSYVVRFDNGVLKNIEFRDKR